MLNVFVWRELGPPCWVTVQAILPGYPRSHGVGVPKEWWELLPETLVNFCTSLPTSFSYWVSPPTYLEVVTIRVQESMTNYEQTYFKQNKGKVPQNPLWQWFFVWHWISGSGFHPQVVLEGTSSSLLDNAGETSSNSSCPIWMFCVSAPLHHHGSELRIVSRDSVQNVRTLLLELTQWSRITYICLYPQTNQDATLVFFVGSFSISCLHFPCTQPEK